MDAFMDMHNNFVSFLSIKHAITSVENMLRVESVVKVLSLFFYFYNIFGINAINIKNRKASAFSVVCSALNASIGIYFLYDALSLPFFDIQYSRQYLKTLRLGTVLIRITGMISNLTILTLNFTMKNRIRDLINAFIRLDKQVKKLFDLEHRKQLILLLIFWIPSKLFFIRRLINCDNLKSFYIELYVVISSFIVNELSLVVLFLVAFRIGKLENLNQVSSNLQEEVHSETKIRQKFQVASISLLQCLDIIRQISRCFGIQIMCSWTIKTILGMFTILSAYNVIFLKSFEIQSSIFRRFIQFTSCHHVEVVLYCLINSFILRKVSIYMFNHGKLLINYVDCRFQTVV